MACLGRVYNIVNVSNMDIKEITEHLSTQSYTGPKDIWKLFLSIEGYFGIPNLILAKGTTLYRATVVKKYIIN